MLGKRNSPFVDRGKTCMSCVIQTRFVIFFTNSLLGCYNENDKGFQDCIVFLKNSILKKNYIFFYKILGISCKKNLKNLIDLLLFNQDRIRYTAIFLKFCISV